MTRDEVLLVLPRWCGKRGARRRYSWLCTTILTWVEMILDVSGICLRQ